MAEILCLCAHPDRAHSRVSARLMDSLAATPFPPGRLELRDLYRLYPDYAIDIEAEQQALAQARLVIWLHPIHWYGMPALMKLWLDEVFSYGWAYGPGGHALQGKDLWLLLSTGGAEAAYSPQGHHRHAFQDFLLPYEQTARLCGLRLLPPQVLHGAHRADDDTIAQHVRDAVQHLLNYPHWCGTQSAEQEELPAGERPAEAQA